MSAKNWIDDVLQFWFVELQPSQWFMRDARTDAAVGDRFAAVYERARSMQPDQHASPPEALAAVLALDQFPRNMFRNTPRAFESDALALATSAAAIGRGFDDALGRDERVFLYMPWQHSEDAAAQVRSVQLFGRLGDAVALNYAQQHKDVIDRFGRFPHRNRVLQRASTPAELEFLRTHAGF